MCGIAGWIGNIDFNKTNYMLDVMEPRGPDSYGEWISINKQVWLGHRRLKILDLSDRGNQPMTSNCKKYVLCYNGEIYNFKTLKINLQKKHNVVFNGESDTEVLLNALIIWGVDKTLKEIKGMYAFAFYDILKEITTLVRDPFGIKPLYYYIDDKSLIFSSNLDSLRASGHFVEDYNIDALHYYLKYLCTPHPETILENVKKLSPGSKLIFKNNNFKIVDFITSKSLKKNRDLTFGNAINELDNILKEVIDEQMASDVSYGAFLSGGIDSSLVVSIMQSISKKPIKTFSVGFSESKNDESIFAKEVANFLKTKHYQKTLLPEDIKNGISRVISIHDEPFADNSSIPTYFLCEFAKNYITVALSGDGGDELFGGYPRYFWASRIQKLQKTLGMPISKGLGSSLDYLKYLSKFNKFFEQISRLGRYLKTERDDVYPKIISCWNGEAPLKKTYKKLLGNDTLRFPEHSWSEEMMLIDQKHYLCDDILTKVDRMSMAVSLEARVPLLDTRVSEYASRIDDEMKLGGNLNVGKLILREILSRYLPRKLYERTKSGFGLPIEKWLRNDLKKWSEEFFNLKRLQNYPQLDDKKIMSKWKSFLDGNDLYREMWSIISLMIWLDNKGAYKQK